MAEAKRTKQRQPLTASRVRRALALYLRAARRHALLAEDAASEALHPVLQRQWTADRTREESLLHRVVLDAERHLERSADRRFRWATGTIANLAVKLVREARRRIKEPADWERAREWLAVRLWEAYDYLGVEVSPEQIHNKLLALGDVRLAEERGPDGATRLILGFLHEVDAKTVFNWKKQAEAKMLPLHFDELDPNDGPLPPMLDDDDPSVDQLDEYEGTAKELLVFALEMFGLDRREDAAGIERVIEAFRRADRKRWLRENPARSKRRAPTKAGRERGPKRRSR